MISSLGGALEFYDFVIFVFMASVLKALFFPPDLSDWLRLTATYGIFAAGYLVRPLGGVVIAHFGDRHGRKRTFTLSIMLMALPTLCIGVLPSYASVGAAAPLLLLAMRLCQGCAIGGETPGAWVFVTEHVPPSRVGLACGVLTAGLAAGILLGACVAAAVGVMFPGDTLTAGGGWRYPFLLGGALGFVALWMRQYLRETPVFTRLKAAQRASLPIKTVLTRHRRGLLLAGGVTWVLTGFVVVMLLLLPSLLEGRTLLSASTLRQGAMLAAAGDCVGCVVIGRLADRYGYGQMLALFCVAASLCLAACTACAVTGWPGFWVGCAAMGFCSGVTGIIPVMVVNAFPAAVRFTGVSLSYNVAYALFGGVTPLLMGSMMTYTLWVPVIYVGGLAALGVYLGLCSVYLPLTPTHAGRLSRDV